MRKTGITCSTNEGWRAQTWEATIKISKRSNKGTPECDKGLQANEAQVTDDKLI